MPTEPVMEAISEPSLRGGEVLSYAADMVVGAGGRYRIVRQLGRGGMSVVYQARDTTLGEDVALKFLLGSISQSGFGEIREEVRLAHRVAHPNVCRVYDLEEIDGRHCIKMEYVGGRTLADLLGGPRLPMAEIARIGAAICAGLHAVHAQGIVHRDLKPSNVVIEHGTGRVVLMDFGLARGRIDASSPVAGTPAYMSPEQAAGRAPDPRSDLYSLGVVLYELAAERRPFDHKSVEQMTRAHLHSEPPALPRAVPLYLRRVIMRLLEKDPEARFPSGAAAEQALLGARRRRRIRIAIVGAVLVVGAALLLRPRSPAPLPPELWRPALKTLSSQEENLDKPALSPDGKLIAIPSTRGPGGNWDIWLLQAQDPSNWRPLTQDPEADEDPQFIDDGTAVLFFSTRAGRSGLWRVDVAKPGPPQFVRESARGSFAATLDGRRVLYQRTPRDLALLDVRTLASQDVVHFPANEGFTDIAIDADGKRAVLGVRKSSEGGFFVITRSDLYLVSLPGGEGKYLTTDSDFNCTAAFIPDEPGALIVSSHRGGAQNLWKFFLDGRPSFQLTSGGGGDDVFPTLSPDGKRLYYTHDNTVTQLWLREPGGKEWRRLTGELIDHSGPTLDAKGKMLVFATYNRETGARQLMTATLPGFEPRPLGSYPQVLEPALTPDGKELVATRLDGEQRALVLLGAKGALIGMVSQGQNAPFCGGATLSADHDTIAFAHDRGDTGLYLSTRGGAATVLFRDVACYARFSPQRPNLLAYLRRTSPGSGQLELRDVSTSKTRVLATLPFDSTRVAWDPSGDAIYVSDYQNRLIRRLAVADGKILEEISAPGDNMVALAAGPNGLLVAEGSVGRTRLLAIENIRQSPR